MKATKPEPSKLNLRMPPALRAEAEAEAQAMGVSLNAYCLLALRNFIPFTQRQTPRSTAASPAPKPTPTRAAVSSTARSPAANKWPKVGRNDPCPCGSGRKAKQCHPEAC